MSRFWALSIAAAAVACGHAAERPAGLSNRAPTADGAALAAGDYTCRLREGGYDYPPFRCVVAARGHGLWLEKVEGSVRFRGAVTRAPDAGFAFDGELYCPWGDCTERVHTVFAADGAGGYRGAVTSLKSGPITVILAHVAGGYGGDVYGGGGYGGYGYGGADVEAPMIDP